ASPVPIASGLRRFFMACLDHVLSTRHESRAGPIAGLRDNLICSIPAYFNDLAASVAILRTWPRQRRGLRASFAPVVGGQKRCIGEQLRCLAQGCANHGNAAKATSMPSVLFREIGIVAYTERSNSHRSLTALYF